MSGGEVSVWAKNSGYVTMGGISRGGGGGGGAGGLSTGFGGVLRLSVLRAPRVLRADCWTQCDTRHSLLTRPGHPLPPDLGSNFLILSSLAAPRYPQATRPSPAGRRPSSLAAHREYWHLPGTALPALVDLCSADPPPWLPRPLAPLRQASCCPLLRSPASAARPQTARVGQWSLCVARPVSGVGT